MERSINFDNITPANPDLVINLATDNSIENLIPALGITVERAIELQQQLFDVAKANSTLDGAATHEMIGIASRIAKTPAELALLTFIIGNRDASVYGSPFEEADNVIGG